MSIAPRDEPEASEILALKEESEARGGAAVVQPDGWARPRGYTNGAVASEKIVNGKPTASTPNSLAANTLSGSVTTFSPSGPMTTPAAR